ncbi:17412_t:CDS:2, partial [Funneliformis geosporum]
ASSSHERSTLMRPRISKQGKARNPEGVPSTKGRFDIAVDLSSLRKNSKRPFNTIRASSSHERSTLMRPRISKQGKARNPEGVPSTKGRFDIAVRLQNEEILTFNIARRFFTT